MEPKGDVDFFLDEIRKELNSIVNDSSSSAVPALKFTNTLTKNTLSSGSAEKRCSGSGAVNKRHNRVDPKVLENLVESETSQRASFVERQASKNIDENLKRMQLDLQQSYELFQTTSDKFGNIDFSGLKNRIKNLNLSERASAVAKSNTDEWEKKFNQKYADNQLDKLTTEMGEKFGKHQGEFGDIPELSTFFQTCTQLEHGLEQLKRQRNEVSDLQKRMCWASEVAYDRIDEIRALMADDVKKP